MSSFENVPHPKPRLKPPRYSLLGLMTSVTAVAIACAVLAGVSGHSAIWISIFLLAIGAHVAGNALGTRLRQLGTQQVKMDVPHWDTPQLDGGSSNSPNPLVASSFAPASQLSKRSALGWPILALSGLGAVLGGVAGGVGFQYVYGDQLSFINLCLGIVGAGAIGTFVTFSGCSLARVFWGAWRQAANS